MFALAEMIKSVVKKTLAVDFPHLSLPSVVYASVTTVRSSGGWYEYKLTVLDRFGSPDGKYPALPEVKSRKFFQTGTKVAVALPYGELTPVILEEVDI